MFFQCSDFHEIMHSHVKSHFGKKLIWVGSLPRYVHFLICRYIFKIGWDGLGLSSYLFVCYYNNKSN